MDSSSYVAEQRRRDADTRITIALWTVISIAVLDRVDVRTSAAIWAAQIPDAHFALRVHGELRVSSAFKNFAMHIHKLNGSIVHFDVSGPSSARRMRTSQDVCHDC